MCSLLFYILDFPLRKHPWRLGGHEFNSYSWQNEKIQFSQKISTFSTSHRELNVFFCSFTSLISPFESTLKNWEVMSSILTHDRMKKSNFLRRFQLFPHLTESKMCSICSFTSLIYPFESTLEDWEVMNVQFLINDMNEKIKFSQKISTFSHLTESKMCSFALLHPWFPPSKAPLKIGRSWVQFLLMTEWKNQIFSRRFQLFRHLTES